jgi:hypothetical protein
MTPIKLCYKILEAPLVLGGGVGKSLEQHQVQDVLCFYVNGSISSHYSRVHNQLWAILHGLQHLVVIPI